MSELSQETRALFIAELVRQIRQYPTKWTPESLLDGMLGTLPRGIVLIDRQELEALRKTARSA
ncbi:MAG: hypothetical protein H0X45_12410 [Planctomycetes bacterium]|nr:hypothetical protein [Planctomycetota bacterium]